jgi:hypothetical protein
VVAQVACVGHMLHWETIVRICNNDTHQSLQTKNWLETVNRASITAMKHFINHYSPTKESFRKADKSTRCQWTVFNVCDQSKIIRFTSILSFPHPTSVCEIKQHDSQMTWQSNDMTVKWHDQPTTWQSNDMIVKQHDSQSNDMTVKWHDSQTTWQSNNMIVKRHVTWTANFLWTMPNWPALNNWVRFHKRTQSHNELSAHCPFKYQ